METLKVRFPGKWGRGGVRDLLLFLILGIMVKWISTSNLKAVLQQWTLLGLICDPLSNPLGNRWKKYFISSSSLPSRKLLSNNQQRLPNLANKTQDTQLNLEWDKQRIHFEYIHVLCNIWDILNNFSLCILDSNLTGHPIFYLAT